ncbi:MAG: universal stress protein [Candidatus Eremiobacteraeota bacterium]|nr:universal stress protein [Candidatus Eremiobacteraeota bacterium]
MIPLDARPSASVVKEAAGLPFLRTLLVATDGSANGDRAVSYALALAHRHGSELLLCYAVDHAKAVAECSVSNGGGELLMPLV